MEAAAVPLQPIAAVSKEEESSPSCVQKEDSFIEDSLKKQKKEPEQLCNDGTWNKHFAARL